MSHCIIPADKDALPSLPFQQERRRFSCESTTPVPYIFSNNGTPKCEQTAHFSLDTVPIVQESDVTDVYIITNVAVELHEADCNTTLKHASDPIMHLTN